MNFGEFFRERRLELGFTLREFCEKHNLDPGNISKLERGKLAPPKESKLKEYAKYLSLKKGSERYKDFFDLAAISSEKLPPEFTEKEIASRLPVFFRTVRGKKLSKQRINKLIKILKDV